MLQSYVQYLNVGFGIINNMEPVDAWNSESAMERALSLDNPDNDVRIIGFRFYDMDTDTNVVEKQSGIFYLYGDIFTYPKVDSDVTSYLTNSNMNLQDGEQIIKVMKPNLFVYKFHDNDNLLDTENAMLKIKIKKETERRDKLEKELTEYKTKLLEAIAEVQKAIENDKYSSIDMEDLDSSGEKRALNILDDGGNFGQHVDLLRKKRIEMSAIDKMIKNAQKNE